MRRLGMSGQFMNLTPKFFHEIRNICLLASKNGALLAISEFNESIIRVGKEFEFWVVQRGKLELTGDGVSLAKAKHWRLWSPTAIVSGALGKEKAKNYFIGSDALKNRPKVVDLFSGVGGLSSGFHAQAFDVVLAIDNDKEACEAHALNFPHTLVEKVDINKVTENLSEFFSSRLNGDVINGVIGGPPCQGFSYMGERNTGDERNLLTSRFVDVVVHLKPDFFVMENVPGLMNSGLPPKFSTYFTRLGKSIGEYASKIVDDLPSVPKSVGQRDRQFRKRLISACIKDFGGVVVEGIGDKKMNPATTVIVLDGLLSVLTQMLKEALQNVYPDGLDVSKFLSEHEVDLFVIALSNLIDAYNKGINIDGKKLLDRECETYVKEVMHLLVGAPAFKSCLNLLILDYDQAPQGGEFKGKKVGPILLNLIRRLEHLYDIASPEVLNAADFGTPQRRERMFLVGTKKDLNLEFLYPVATHCVSVEDGMGITPSCEDAISDLPDIDVFDFLKDGHELPSKNYSPVSTAYQQLMRLEDIEENDFALNRETWDPELIDCCNRTIHAPQVLERLRGLEEGKQEPVSHKPRLHSKKLSPTLRAGTRENKGSHTAVRPVHYKYDRVISVREGARLMGYPDWMTFHKTKWHGFRLVGNGVPFHLSKAVASTLKELLY